jgi:hypothetical protein
MMSKLMRRALHALAALSLLAGGVGIAHGAGALAIGACGAYGFAYDYPQLGAAQTAALKKCTGACKTVAVKRGCAAFAIDGHNRCGPNGYAVASRLGQAQNTALSYCYRYGGKDCVIRAWVCDAKG